MSQPSKAPAQDALADLAAKIYMELICRNVVVTESAAQIKSNPENLARISFKLAEAFQRIDAEIKGNAGPKNQNFDVNDIDLSNWNAAKT